IVQEEKKGLPGVVLQPSHGRAVDLLAYAAAQDPIFTLVGKPTIVGLEALIQSEPGIQGEGADESSRLIAGVAEGFRQSDIGICQAVEGVQMNSMRGRIGAREHRTV